MTSPPSLKPDDETFEEAIRYILNYIGDNPEREELRKTPQRVRRAFQEYFGGYTQDVTHHLSKVFRVKNNPNSLILLQNIEFSSYCEHHIAPFYGYIHIAYLPKDGFILGTSKLAHIAQVFARRLQLQERLTQEINQSLTDALNPLGAMTVIDATHGCMTCRGVQQKNTSMRTIMTSGILTLENPMYRNILESIDCKSF